MHYSLSVASLIVYSAQIYEVDLIGENREFWDTSGS
jgi:hypothetical protein